MDKTTNFCPSIVIIGAAKSGTTTLYNELSKHPAIYGPSEKEPGILARSRDDEHAIAMYKKHFEARPKGSLVIEATTTYTGQPPHPSVIKRAKSIFDKSVIIIYIVRNPLDRIVSHLTHDVVVGRIDSSAIDDVVRNDARYLSWSRYDERLRPWIDAFGKKNVICINFEFFVKNNSIVLKKIFEILKIEIIEPPKSVRKANARGVQRSGRFKFVNLMSNSTFYRSNVAQILPKPIKSLGKKLLTHAKSPPNIKLTSETEELIERDTCRYEEKLQRLGVHLIGFDSSDEESIV